jgi:hypothetical protein
MWNRDRYTACLAALQRTMRYAAIHNFAGIRKITPVKVMEMCRVGLGNSIEVTTRCLHNHPTLVTPLSREFPSHPIKTTPIPNNL